MANEGKGKPRGIKKAVDFVARMLQGAVIGGGAILPGISGGVLSVVFGIYRPMMDFFSAPLKGFKKYWRMFLPVVIGWFCGFILFADVIAKLMGFQPNAATWLFIGLIGGTLHSLFREAGKEGRSKVSWISLGCCFVLMLALMLMTRLEFSAGVQPNVFWFLFCGVLWGLSLIVPGMTSSSILMSMGLFEPMTAGLGSLDLQVLLPMVLGILAVVALMSRLVNRLFQKHYNAAFHGILGIVLATTIAIVPVRYSGLGEGALCLAACGIGFLISWFLEEKLVPPGDT